MHLLKTLGYRRVRNKSDLWYKPIGMSLMLALVKPNSIEIKSLFVPYNNDDASVWSSKEIAGDILKDDLDNQIAHFCYLEQECIPSVGRFSSPHNIIPRIFDDEFLWE